MAKPPIAEFFATLKSYAQKLSEGERTPSEIASALNDWAHDSAESLRAKIHEEVEHAVLKMGFVKREEFDALAKEVAALKGMRSGAPRKSSPQKRTVKKRAVKSAPKKKVAK